MYTQNYLESYKVLQKFYKTFLKNTSLNLFLLRPLMQDEIRKHPNWYLIVQNQQWKHQNNVWNLFEANNKDIRRTSWLLTLSSSRILS